MKLHLIFVLLLFSTAPLFAQSVTVQPVQDHSTIGQSEFPLKNGKLVYSQASISIGESEFFSPEVWGISPGGSKVSLLQSQSVMNLILTAYDGTPLSETELEFFEPGDATLGIYTFDDGRVITRDNVANFTMFDPSGERIYSVSNSTQSEDGERPSRLSADRLGQTVVLYNPVINYGTSRGSRARVIFGEDDDREIYRNNEREIEQSAVTSNGSFITLLTTGGGDDMVHIYDRFGNQLREFSVDSDQRGVSLSENGEFLTTYTRGRVQVYNTVSGERLGSTSSRNPVLYATYIPEDDIIIAFGGTENSGNITEPMVTAVHIGQRQIAREDVSGQFSMIDPARLQITREASGQYNFSGLNRTLSITAQF